MMSAVVFVVACGLVWRLFRAVAQPALPFDEPGAER